MFAPEHSLYAAKAGPTLGCWLNSILLRSSRIKGLIAVLRAMDDSYNRRLSSGH